MNRSGRCTGEDSSARRAQHGREQTSKLDLVAAAQASWQSARRVRTMHSSSQAHTSVSLWPLSHNKRFGTGAHCARVPNHNGRQFGWRENAMSHQAIGPGPEQCADDFFTWIDQHANMSQLHQQQSAEAKPRTTLASVHHLAYHA